jgi:hypothetical protein
MRTSARFAAAPARCPARRQRPGRSGARPRHAVARSGTRWGAGARSRRPGRARRRCTQRRHRDRMQTLGALRHLGLDRLPPGPGSESPDSWACSRRHCLRPRPLGLLGRSRRRSGRRGLRHLPRFAPDPGRNVRSGAAATSAIVPELRVPSSRANASDGSGAVAWFDPGPRATPNSWTHARARRTLSSPEPLPSMCSHPPGAGVTPPEPHPSALRHRAHAGATPCGASQ